MSYKTELHCHTSEFSPCSNVSGADTAEKYIAAGYSTVVITNHFVKGARGITDYGELCEKLFCAADIVRRAAGDRLHVLTGFELCYADPYNPNDYLVYGLTEQDLLEIPEIFDMKPEDFHDFARDHGALVIQAHPFRPNMRVINPWTVDGVEVFNGHPGHHSHNDVAKMWGMCYAEQEDRDYILTSGTDHHNEHHVPNGGIKTDEEIVTMDDLLRALRSNRFRRIGGNRF